MEAFALLEILEEGTGSTVFQGVARPPPAGRCGPNASTCECRKNIRAGW